MSILLNFIKKLKNDYINKFGEVAYTYPGKTCVQAWAEILGDNIYIDILENVTTRQKGDFVIFKYMNFEVLFTRLDGISYSKFWDIWDGIYRECRGAVIDVRNECFVTRPFDKFFGLNEKEETHEKNLLPLIKKSKVEFTDKLDGSIIISRWYKNDIIVTSSGMFDSDIISKASQILHEQSYTELLMDYKDYTVMFESIEPNDSHIVSYSPDMYGLHLIGLRNVATGKLIPYSEIIRIAAGYSVPTTAYYDMSFAEILDSRKDYKAEEKEGYVMYLNRMLVKIKCDDYIMIHKMMQSNCSMNDIVKAIHKDKIDDLLQSVPETYHKKIEYGIQVISEYEKLMEREVKKYSASAPKERKEFFKWVKTIPPFIQRYVIAKYLGNSFSYLTVRDDGKQVQYIKYSEIEKISAKLKQG